MARSKDDLDGETVGTGPLGQGRERSINRDARDQFFFQPFGACFGLGIEAPFLGLKALVDLGESERFPGGEALVRNRQCQNERTANRRNHMQRG